MTTYDDRSDHELSPAAQLGLQLARADLGYVAAALAGRVVGRALTFLPHAVLVAFEAHAFCSRQLGIEMPELAWNQALATAARNSGKFFDDNRRDLTQLVSDVNTLAEATRKAFTSGVRRRLARSLGCYNPDLSVLFVTAKPVSTNVTFAFHAGAKIPGPHSGEQAGRTAHDLARGVGQMVTILGGDTTHRPPASDLDAEWSWRDGESQACYGEAFGGELPASHVPLMLMLQGAVATAALLARTDCCSECQVAAFKHRLVVAHHAARSLWKLKNAGPLGRAAAERVDAMLAEPPMAEVARMRALRNGLVHLGLSDVPESAFASPNPLGSVVAHYETGRTQEYVDHVTNEAIAKLHAQLTEWLLTAPPGGTGVTAVLRPPA